MKTTIALFFAALLATCLALFFATLLAACLGSPRSEVTDLCGDPPLISGIASFLTVIQDQPYVCATADNDHQRALAISLTRQWEQCMTEARTLASTLIAARRDRNAARAAVDSWMSAASTTVHPEQSPGWAAYARSESIWEESIAEFDSKEQP
jgi:hypothetical protein